MWKLPGKYRSLLLMVCFASSRAYSDCDPDDHCKRHRICAFGSLAAYSSVASNLFQITSCQKCELDCSGQCSCSIPSSRVQREINKQIWCQSPVCQSPLAQHALQYSTSGYDCELSFQVAQQQLIKLCGRVNGVCCNGTLKNSLIMIAHNNSYACVLRKLHRSMANRPGSSGM